MKKVILIGLSLLASTANAANNKTLEGFKEIKFGMTESQLVEMGFSCKDSSSVDGEKSCHSFGYNNTVFDEKILMASGTLDVNGKLKSISLMVPLDRCTNIKDTMENSLGKPDQSHYKPADYSKGISITISTNSWKMDNGSIQHIFFSMRRDASCSVSFDSANFAKPIPKKSSDF